MLKREGVPLIYKVENDSDIVTELEKLGSYLSDNDSVIVAVSARDLEKSTERDSAIFTTLDLLRLIFRTVVSRSSTETACAKGSPSSRSFENESPTLAESARERLIIRRGVKDSLRLIASVSDLLKLILGKSVIPTASVAALL